MIKTLFIALLLLSIPAFAANTAYSFVIEDLPLMTGMIEQPEDAVTFDKPGGRIVETTALTQSNPAEVRAFYAAALPPLGWKPAGASKFLRDKEELTLDIDAKSGKTAVRFTLTPINGGGK